MNLEWRHAELPGLNDSIAADFEQRRDIFTGHTVIGHLVRAGALRGADACEVLNVHYLPGRRLTVIYRLQGPYGRTIRSVDFHRNGASAAAAATAHLASWHPDDIVHLPGWDAVAYRFPEDPALPELRTLVEGEESAHRLAPVAGSDLVDEALDWSLLSYLPGRRAALRQAWPARGLAVVGKLQAGAAASHAAMRRLWRAPGRRFCMAEPLALAPMLSVRWERFAAGERIDALLATQPLPLLLQRVAGGLADLHASRVPGLSVQGPDEILRRLQRKVLPRIEQALPELSIASTAFARRLALATRDLPPRPLRLIHGDLHTANVLLDGERAVFIDLDSLALGDPAFDLALLGTRLLLSARKEGAVSGATAAAIAALPALYAEAGGEEIPENVFAWYVAALLVARQIKTCIRHLAPALPQLADHLLDTAQAVLAAGRVEAETLAG